MNQLENFLEKFKRFLNAPGQDKKLIADCIFKESGITLEEKDISLQDGVVYIQSNPSIRSEIYMRKKSILNRLNDLAKPRIFKDIR